MTTMASSTSTHRVRVDNLDTRARLVFPKEERQAAEQRAEDIMREHAAETGHALAPAQIHPGKSFRFCADCGNVASVGR